MVQLHIKVLIFWSLFIATQSIELVTEPKLLVIEKGKAGEITCKYADDAVPSNPEELIWFNANGTAIKALNTTEVTDEKGVLSFQDVNDHQTGMYNCTTESGQLWIKAEVRVYNMPSYFVEGMIIVGINAFLIVLFFGCSFYKFITERRQKQLEHRRNRRKL